MKRLIEIFQALLGVAALICVAFIAVGRLAWRTIRNWWKNRSKWFRRSICSTILLVAMGFVMVVAYAIYRQEYGRDYYDKRLTDDISLHSFSDNKWRLYNLRTGEYTTDKINWLSDVADGDSLAVYAIPHRRGYINVNTGRVVIDAKANNYTKAWLFSEGLAAVMQGGKIGFINAQNEVVIPFQFDFNEKLHSSDFGFAFHQGYCVMTNSDGDVGLINSEGKWVVEPIYDEIWAPEDNGYRVVYKDDKYGVLDSLGAVARSVEYDYASVVSDGLILTREGCMWKEDFEGNIVQPFMFDATYYLKYPNGYDECGEIAYAFADYIKYEVLNNYGIMNRITGKPLTPAIYSNINMLSKELFEVQGSNCHEWHLIDSQGNAVSKE